MNRKPIESDWKVYRERIGDWRDRHLARKNAEILAILTDEARAPTEQFWHAMEKMEKEARIVDTSFGRFARSQMEFNLVKMYGQGIVDDADLEEFSQDLRERVRFATGGFEE